jgi:hypothetical protein
MPASAKTSQELERPASGSPAVAPLLLVEDLVKRFDTPDGPITAALQRQLSRPTVLRP